MPAYAYRIVNVFTQGRTVLSGNPLCVFERAQALDGARMQALALQFNLSETAFILPSERANARVRIFTPQYEMPFAGHPTLGTAHVCRALGLGGDRLTLEMPAGVVPVRASGDRWTLQARAAGWREVAEPRSRWLPCPGSPRRTSASGRCGSPPAWNSSSFPSPARRRCAACTCAGPAGAVHRTEGKSMVYVFPRGDGSPGAILFRWGTRPWRIRRPAPRRRTSAAGTWRWAGHCH
jgi:hypothetical protein